MGEMYQPEKPTSGSEDLSEQFKGMSIHALAGYTMGFNITLTNGTEEGILIGYLDLERDSNERVKVLVNGETKFWDESKLTFVKAEKRWAKPEDEN